MGPYIHAENHLAISTEGTLTNNHRLYADGSVKLTATTLNNGEKGRISSAETRLSVSGNVLNKGVINSVNNADNADNADSADNTNNALTLIKANRIENIGKGRIYGDRIALQADSVLNQDKSYETGISAPIIAARQHLAIAAREVENNTQHYLNNTQTGSTLFSSGDIFFGRYLNEHYQAVGQAEHIRNNSGIIEAEKNIWLNAKNIDNRNVHFSVEHVIKDNAPTERTKVEENAVNKTFISLGWPQSYVENPLNTDKSSINYGDAYIPVEQLRWENWSRAGQYVYKNNSSSPVELKAGEVITPYTHLAMRNEMTCKKVMPASDCHYIPAGQYGIDSPIWHYFGIEAPKEPAPFTFSFMELEQQPWYQESEWFDEEDKLITPKHPDSFIEAEEKAKAQLKWDYYIEKIKPIHDWEEKYQASLTALDSRIEEHNEKRLARLPTQPIRNFWRLDIKKQRIDESQVQTSLPGQILAGGC